MAFRTLPLIFAIATVAFADTTDCMSTAAPQCHETHTRDEMGIPEPDFFVPVPADTTFDAAKAFGDLGGWSSIDCPPGTTPGTPTAVPEPGTLAMAGGTLLILARRRTWRTR
jgi:hypothetical protein